MRYLNAELDAFWLRHAYKPYELLAGQVQPMRRLSFAHNIMLLRLATNLEQFVEEQQLGDVMGANAGFALNANTIRSPRAAFLQTKLYQQIRYPYRYIPFAPTIAIECFSAHDDMTVLRDCVRDYLRAGAQQVWCILPDEQAVLQYMQGGKYRRLRRGHVLEAEPWLPAWGLPLAQLFPKLG